MSQQIQSAAAEIDRAVSERAMLAHPFYEAWTEGRLPREVLREYAKQYFHHVEAFPQVVSAVHAVCPHRAGRRMLAENLAEEEGVGEGKEDHASLWLNFAAGVGASEADVHSVELNPETQNLIAAFRRLSAKSYASGLGALYAYESQLPAVSTSKIAGLSDFYDVADETTTRFFRVHEQADLEHSTVCRELLDTLPAKQRDEAAAAGAELAGALWSFLSGVQKKAGLVY